MAYFELDLNTITVDLELVRQLPYALSSYYLMFPLARENGSVSVVMAHPDNQAALALLSHLLQAHIVPVLGKAVAIERALQWAHQPQPPTAVHTLVWSETATGQTAVAEAAAHFNQAIPMQLTTLPEPTSRAAAMDIANSNQFNLTIFHLADETDFSQALNLLSTPALFVRGPFVPPKQFLVVLRGFASDAHIVETVVPLAKESGALVTMMPLAGFSVLDSSKTHLLKPHFESCLGHLQQNNVYAQLKVRQGDPVEQVVNELADGRYDLLVIAAEAQGDFVSSVFTAVCQQQLYNGRLLFILKPPTSPPHTATLSPSFTVLSGEKRDV